MSLSKSITKSIEYIIDEYIKKISKKYNVDKNDLKSLWTGELVNSTNVSTNLDSEMDDLSPSRLYNCGKAELIALCKYHNKKCSGKKTILINRLLNRDENTDVIMTKKKSVNKDKEQPTIIKKLTANIPNLIIKKNKFGKYEHKETGFIFNDTKVVIGKQNIDGSINQLNEEDIDICNSFKFKFKFPVNLDENKLDNIEIEKLDEEVEEVEEVEDVEEVEEVEDAEEVEEVEDVEEVDEEFKKELEIIKEEDDDIEYEEEIEYEEGEENMGFDEVAFNKAFDNDFFNNNM